MTKIFICSGNTYRVADNASIQTFDDLPAFTYTVKLDDRSDEFYLERIADFSLPPKIYGANNNYAKRILHTFNDRTGGTGVLLNGIKGAGKTLLAKQTSVDAQAMGIPTIVINRDWHGDVFNSFIQSITTPAIILFDEFEKIYDYQTQRQVLTLLDGVYNSRKLFLITTNSEHDISEYMRNRPGRVYYNFTFNTLGQDFISEYLEDRLDDKSKIASILDYTSIFTFVNFDMLAAMVEEMNRYNETLNEVLEVLNIQPENKGSDTYKLEVVVDGKKTVVDNAWCGFQPNQFEYTLWLDSDMSPDIRADDALVTRLNAACKAHEASDSYITFNSPMLSGFDAVVNRFVFSYTDKSIELHVTRNNPVDAWKYQYGAM